MHGLPPPLPRVASGGGGRRVGAAGFGEREGLFVRDSENDLSGSSAFGLKPRT